MRILLVSSGSGSRGGGEIFLKYLGEGLAEAGHEVLMWIPSHPRMDELAAKCARFARIVRSNYRNTYDHPARSLATLFTQRASRRIAREWEAVHPDIVHLNKQNLEDGLDLVRATRCCRIPSVCTIHLTQSARQLRAKAAGLRDLIATKSLRRYQGVLVAVQEARRDNLERLVGESIRARTVLSGVPSIIDSSACGVRDKRRRELGLTDRDFLVLGVGRLVEQKRPFEFLEAAEALHRRSPHTKFLWIGDGELRTEWTKCIARKGLEKVVSCIGWQDDVATFLLAGDLLLHLAEYEGFPLAIIEAMASSLPCAVSRGFASEIALLSESAVTFVDDFEDLARQIDQPRVLKEKSNLARQIFERHLSTEAMVEGYMMAYAEALAVQDQQLYSHA
jgi:glycosyltransferase involved in cell wall biosynthesis